MRLILLENDLMVSEVVCGREAIYIGAREDCRIHLPDSRIAPQQALIFPENNGNWVLQQLNDEHEIHVNGTSIHTKVTLKTGDEIQIFDYVIRVFPEHEEQATGRADTHVSTAQLMKFVQHSLPPGAITKKSDEALGVQPGQMHRIGQVHLKLAQCLEPQQLMNIALQTFLEIFVADRAWTGVRRVNYGSMEYVEGRLLSGQTTDLPQHGENLKPRVLDRGQYVLIPRYSREDRTSVMAGPLIGPDGPLGMVYLEIHDAKRSFAVHDLDYFILLCNAFGVQLDAIFKEIAKNRAATIAGEVSVAHEVQTRLTPRKLPQWEGLQFGAFREPGREHTGDVYDLVRLANNQAAFFISHTRAGGAWPTMLMAQSQATFRHAAMHADAPHVFLRSLNWLLYDGQPDHALHCFMGYLDPNTGQLRYAMAGATGAYVIGGRGEERKLGSHEPTPALGLDKATTYGTLTEQVEPGETLVVFTPGVTTAKNRQGQVFGEDRFVNILCDGFGQLASGLLKEMLSDLQSFTEGGQQPNDITVLLAHRVDE